jgi:hypothetical protein
MYLEMACWEAPFLAFNFVKAVMIMTSYLGCTGAEEDDFLLGNLGMLGKSNLQFATKPIFNTLYQRNANGHLSTANHRKESKDGLFFLSTNECLDFIYFNFCHVNFHLYRLSTLRRKLR